MKNFIIFLLAITLTAAVGCGKSIAQMGKASDFTLRSADGKDFKLSDHAGKVIILDFFGVHCPACKMEMPTLNELAEEYKGQVEVIGIEVSGSNASQVGNFAKEHKVGFPILMDDNKVSKAYGPINFIPTTYIVDKEMNIVQKFIGMRAKEEFVTEIEKLK